MNNQDVRDLQNAAYAFANAVGGLVEAMGMQAENQSRLSKELPIAYDDKAFHSLMEERGLHHNRLMIQIYEP